MTLHHLKRLAPVTYTDGSKTNEGVRLGVLEPTQKLNMRARQNPNCSALRDCIVTPKNA